jgi:phospholipase A1
MRKPFIACQLFVLVVLLCNSSFVLADSTKSKCHARKCKDMPIPVALVESTPVIDRAINEQKIPSNYIGISFYNPNYVLPYYFTGSPDNSAYEGFTPNDVTLNNGEFKFQFSVKAPLWKNILDHNTSLYLAYTQLSYWQLYNKSTFMRENNYQPEFYFETPVKWHLSKDWHVNFINVGANHVSNGTGNGLQRRWDRVYLEAITSTEHWMFSVRPWLVITKNDNNPDIAKYLGYGRFLLAYKCHQQVVSFETHSIFEQGARYATGQLTWSFPITPYVKGYVQGFSGYGQSLIEYNHRTNSIGVGFALSDWVE